MRIRAVLAVASLALTLSGCADIDLDPFFDDGDTAAVAPNGCTAQGCPQAAQFCQARGYAPGTEAFDRCLVSVNENLRKGQ